MSPRTRVILLVAAAALAAAGATVGITLATRTEPEKAASTAQRTPAGPPPLVLELGVRTDPEARALRRASVLLDRGRRREAAGIFARYRSLEAELGAAFAGWPATRGRIEALGRGHPESAFVQLHVGLALYWQGREPAARAAWRLARRAEPDTPYAVRAGDLLYPNFPRGLPVFVPSFQTPAGLGRLSPPKQLARLERGARTGGVREKLLYGIALQRLGRQVSALREYEAATALAPGDPEPMVAAAVAQFDKADPSRAFSLLGPLSKAHPRSQTVRFHLGLLLLWLGRVDAAKSELRLARAAGPATLLGGEAKRFLDRLSAIR